jgi:hypothetical protein
MEILTLRGRFVHGRLPKTCFESKVTESMSTFNNAAHGERPAEYAAALVKIPNSIGHEAELPCGLVA